MHAPHIVLIDTHGTLMDYTVSTDILAQVFTLLQSTSERQDHPMLKPEYLETREPAPKEETAREIVDEIPSFLSPEPTNVVALEQPEKFSQPDDAAFMASLSNLFKNT